MSFKSGFVAIIGRPNAGKSTLLNFILGEKISIVSRKPQTTRNVIKGVKNLPEAQVVFIDTPGIHRPKGLLNEFMVKGALSAIKDVDCVIYLLDSTRGSGEEEEFILENLKSVNCAVILAINKVDAVEKQKLLPVIERFSKEFSFKDIVPISALKGDGVDSLMNCVVEILPEGPKYFPEDELTDQPERFIVAEIIREKIFRLTQEEVPYSTAVMVEEFKEREGKNLIYIRAMIAVERDSQKAIIIGKKGDMLKKIGSEARTDIESLLGAKVFLELFVKVEKEWTKKKGILKEFGYE